MYNLILRGTMVFVSHSPFGISISVIYLATSIGLCCLIFNVQWIFYTIIIIFLGGMIVVFTYAASASLTNKHSLNKRIFIRYTGLLGLIAFISIRSVYYCERSSIGIINYNYCSFPTIIVLAGLISYSLCLVLKLVSINEGPVKI